MSDPGPHVHVSRLCAETWRRYALPAAVAARELLVETQAVLEERGAEPEGSEFALQLVSRRLEECEQALADMLAWIDAWSRAPDASNARVGVNGFERWYRTYHGAMAAVILCDACRQLRLDGSRLAGPYARWKQHHRALRSALVGPFGEHARSGPLAAQLPFRRHLAEACEPSPPHYLASMDSPSPTGTLDAEGDDMPCFLNGARTQFISEALRSLDHSPLDARAGPVREALERLRSSDRLSSAQLEILEQFVTELAGDCDAGHVWFLQQRLKSIERDLASS